MNIALPAALAEPTATHHGVALIVEDHPLFAKAVGDLISWARPGLAVQRCQCVADALHFLSGSPAPVLIVLDLMLPDSAGASTVGTIARRRPGIPIIVVSAEDSLAMNRAVLEAGAVRFVSKSAKPQEIARAIEDVLGTQNTADAHAEMPAQHGLSHLSPRQREVLEELSTGKSNKEIAIRLSMSPETVKAHVQTILSRLGVRNRTEAVRHFLTNHGRPILQMDH